MMDATERCLVGDASILSAQALWAKANGEELIRWFANDSDESDASFCEVGAPASPSSKKLMIAAAGIYR
jgi:hypothetical protein